jgi:hypothetical protein
LGLRRVYQQTAIDACANVAFTKLHDRKTPLTAADLMNDRVMPFFDEHEIAVSRVLTDRSTEFCGKPASHGYELYLAVENIDHYPNFLRSRAGFPAWIPGSSILRITTEPAPITVPPQMFTGKIVALDPMLTRSPILVDRHKSLRPCAGPPIANVSLVNITPCPMKQSSPISTNSQIMV